MELYKSTFITCQCDNVLTPYLKIKLLKYMRNCDTFFTMFYFIDINTALFGILFKNLKNIIQRFS